MRYLRVNVSFFSKDIHLYLHTLHTVSNNFFMCPKHIQNKKILFIIFDLSIKFLKIFIIFFPFSIQWT